MDGWMDVKVKGVSILGGGVFVHDGDQVQIVTTVPKTNQLQ
jgi:hypothetical protein